MALEIKTAKELVDWTTKSVDEVVKQLGEVADKGVGVEKALGDLKLIVDDLARTRVEEAPSKLHMPVTKEAVVEFGLKAILEAPLKIEKTTEGARYDCGDSPIAQFHEAADDLMIANKLMAGRVPFKTLAKYKTAKARVEALVKDAFDIQNTGQGSDFVPTYFSGSLVEAVRINRVLMSLFESLPMPGGNLTVPTWLTDATAYGFAENTSDSGGTAISDGLAANLITGNFTMTAKGMGLALTFSKFLEEDSIIAWAPFIRRVGVQALVNAEEHAGVSGDTTATHMDTDINAITGDAAKQWKGLRYVGNLSANPAKIDCLGQPINSDAAWRDYVLQGLGLMDKYGVRPGELALVAGSMLNSQLLAVDAFKTLYANGTAATNKNGVITSPFGWNYVLSAELKNNLSATGVNTSGTNALDKTAGMLVHTDSWKKGIVREITVQLLDQTRAKYDQNELVFTMRQAFISARKMDGTEPHVSYLYDIKAA